MLLNKLVVVSLALFSFTSIAQEKKLSLSLDYHLDSLDSDYELEGYETEIDDSISGFAIRGEYLLSPNLSLGLIYGKGTASGKATQSVYQPFSGNINLSIDIDVELTKTAVFGKYFFSKSESMGFYGLAMLGQHTFDGEATVSASGNGRTASLDVDFDSETESGLSMGIGISFGKFEMATFDASYILHFIEDNYSTLSLGASVYL